MLQLAPAAFGEVAARRLLMMRPERKRAIVENGVSGHSKWHVPAARRHAIPASGNPDDRLVHKSAMAAGIAAARSSAIN